MDHLFVSHGSGLNDRWQEAFPDARLVASVDKLSRDACASEAVLWLNISSLVELECQASVAEAVALGWPVVVLTAMPNEAEAFQMLNAGVVGYCHVQAAPTQLCQVSLVVEHGGLWMPPQLMQRLLALSRRVIPSALYERDQALGELTAREQMVAEEVAKSATNREIAATLKITERTVKAHLSVIFEKLQVRDRVQLALSMNHIRIQRHLD